MAPKGKGKGAAAAKAKGKGALEAMVPGGDGVHSLSSHANQVRIFELFLAASTITDAALKAKAGTTFEDMPEEVACSQLIYAFFCTYLTYVYIIAHTANARIRKEGGDYEGYGNSRHFPAEGG